MGYDRNHFDKAVPDSHIALKNSEFNGTFTYSKSIQASVSKETNYLGLFPLQR